MRALPAPAAPRARHDLGIVLERGLPGHELDATAAAVGRRHPGHDLLDHLTQRQTILGALGAQRAARASLRGNHVLRAATLSTPTVTTAGAGRFAAELGVQGHDDLREGKDRVATRCG